MQLSFVVRLDATGVELFLVNVKLSAARDEPLDGPHNDDNGIAMD